MAEADEYLTVAEIAERLKVNPQTVGGAEGNLMITIVPRAAAALHAPSQTDEQRLAISDLFERWTDEGQVQQITKAQILPHGRVLIFYVLAGGQFDACVGVDRNGSVSAL